MCPYEHGHKVAHHFFITICAASDRGGMENFYLSSHDMYILNLCFWLLNL